MFKALGFFLGACLTGVGFLVALRPEPAVETLNRATEGILRVLASRMPPQDTGHLPLAAPRNPGDSDLEKPPVEAPLNRPSPDAEPAPLNAATAVPAAQGEEPAEEDAEADAETGFHPAAPTRQLFWSAFRSELAARGFAKRLYASTAVDVDVVRVSPAQFRVAFDFRDQAHRRYLITRIEEVTGLELHLDESR